MKKILLFLSAVMLCFSAFAKSVDYATAYQVAVNFWNMNSDKECPELVDIAGVLNLTEMYVFATTGNDGFVIVSKDDIATPVLGYSTQNGFFAAEMPENLMGWMQHYSDEIQSARDAGYLGNEETENEWYRLTNNIPSPKAAGRKAVTEMLTTKWNQDSPYNNKCPYDYYNNRQVRSVTGCAATAMAQLLKYWNWPLKGFGTKTYTCSSLNANAPTNQISADFASTTYNWNSMLDGGYDDNWYETANSWTAAQKNAVATLMFHCGVAVSMEYSGGESSAYPTAYTGALKTYFGYGSAANRLNKSSYSDANWKTKVKNELDAKRPLLYSGYGDAQGSGGHAFVCDGYDANNQFHFNWGWSGAGNGYFALDAMTPDYIGTGGGDLGTYHYNQGAIFSISPMLQTVTSFSLNSTTIPMGTVIRGTCGIRNTGSVAFKGYIGVAAYNSAGNFVKILTRTDSISFTANSSRTLTISDTAASPLAPGEYVAKAVCSVNGTSWYVIKYGYNNCATEVPFTITGELVGEPELKVNNAFTLNSSTYAIGETMTGSCGITNVGNGAFTGLVGIGAHTTSGTLVKVMKQTSASIAANASTTVSLNYTVASPLAAGTYVARAIYSTDNGTTWNTITTTSDNTATMVVFRVTEASAATAELKASNGFSLNNNSVAVGGSITGTCGITNVGTATFTGRIGVAAYNTSNTFVAVMTQQSATINANASNTVAINYIVTSAFSAGSYVARPVYSTDNGSSWNIITSSNDNTPTTAVFTVTAQDPSSNTELKVCNGFTFTNQSVTIGSMLSGSCGIRNTAANQFNGKIGVAAYTTSNQLVAVLSQQSAVMAANAERTLTIAYTIPDNFATGTYVARAVYSTDDGENWTAITSTYDNTPTACAFTVSNQSGGETGSANLQTSTQFVIANPNVETGGTIAGVCYLRNSGDADFSGNIGLAIYQSNTRKDIIAQGTATINTGTSSTLTFSQPLSESYTAGTYIMRPVYSIDNGNTWETVNTSYDGTPTILSFTVTDPAPTTYTITVIADDATMGRVGGSGIYTVGTQVQITAEAFDGYHFVRWSDGGDQNHYITVNSNAIYTAYFEADENNAIDNTAALSVKLYPNPVNDVLHIEIDGMDKVEVTDLIGRTLISQTNGSTVDMSRLDKGIYVVRISANGNTVVKKVVKQ